MRAKKQNLLLLAIFLLPALSLDAAAAEDIAACRPTGQRADDSLARTSGLLQAVCTELNLSPDLPEPEALTVWREVPGYVNARINLQSYPRLKVACADKNLYPTHPQTFLKRYHIYNTTQYDARKLKGDSEACTIRQATKNRCLAAAIAVNVVLSDTFQDSCGHFYRGFVHSSFLKKNESMGSLYSPGRELVPRAGSEQNSDGSVHDMVFSNTRPIEEKDFLFLGPLLPKDQEGIASARKSAEATHTFNAKTHLFIEKK